MRRNVCKKRSLHEDKHLAWESALSNASAENGEKKKPVKKRHTGFRLWVRRAFITWAILSTLYLANSFRTQGVDAALLRSSKSIEVISSSQRLEFQPVKHNDAGLVFLCGAGVAAEAYAPMLRPLAELGYPVVIIRLPWRFAPTEGSKEEAIRRAISSASGKDGPRHWVVGGHSLGAALACRAVAQDQAHFSALVLLGTTHPKEADLSQLPIPVTKVFGDKDGIAPREATLANKGLLPASTEWTLIEGANHSQFGNYGWQILDGWPNISRQEQQTQARAAVLKTLLSIGRNKG